MTAYDFSQIYFMLLQTFKFYTMLLAPSSLRFGHKRKLAFSSCLLQISVLILCFLVYSNEAGIIKKRDTTHTANESGNSVLDIKEAEMEPTILTPLSTQLQSTTEQYFATETSKELTNNEILFNEAKKSLEENAIKMVDNETLLKIKSEEEIYSNNNKQDIAKRLEDKEQSVTETLQSTTEFSSNDIKGDKFAKFGERQLENIFKSNERLGDNKATEIGDRTPKSYNGLSTETEKPLTESKVQNKQLDINNIENSQEYAKNEVKMANTDKLMKPEVEQVTAEPLEFDAVKPRSGEKAFLSKTLETSTNTYALKEGKEFPHNSLESAAKVLGSTENMQVVPTSTTVPLKDSEQGNQIKSLETLSKTQHQSNQIYDREVVENQATVPTTTAALSNLGETTLTPTTKEGTKQDHARSLLTEETTTLNFREEVDAVTTFKPLILSEKDGIEEETKQDQLKDQIEDSTKYYFPPLSAKAKKPKFINDNSTNAQQLNLPNNAEVWSLAAMKSLPKANITMETAQTHNQTNKEPNELYNTSSTLNSNSEKNLLDWSQIMMDKELSSTARNEDVTIKHEEVVTEKEQQTENLTTFMPASKVSQFKIQPGIDVITQNSLIELEVTTSTISPAVTTSTILSPLNYKENDNDKSNEADKKVEENLNNHIDTPTATLATTVATNVDNNPFNTSLNIEPNLNEINLTSNQTQVDLNNDVHTENTTTTAGEKSINDDDANVDTFIETETSTAAAMPTTATTTMATTAKTKATAVFNTTRVEQISSETTTVSTLETGKQNVSLNSGVISEQQQQQQNNHKSNNVINEATNSSLSASSHNVLENSVVDSQTTAQYKNIDLTTKATATATATSTTVVPITTYRPTILAITSTTSIPATLEQEVDQKGNEIQTNLTKNTQQQSIIRTGLQRNHSTTAITETHLKERYFETTTQAATQLTTSKLEDTLTSTLKNEATSTTSSSRDEGINETTEINIIASEATTTTQTTPKQVHKHKNTGVEEKEDNIATTGSAGSEDKKFEKASETTTTTTTTTATTLTSETNFSLNTTTETPVALDTESGKELIESATPTTAATAATILEKTTSSTNKQESVTEEIDSTQEDVQTTTAKIMNNTQELATSTTSMPATANGEEETSYISLLDDTTTTTTPTTQSYSTTISTSYAPATTTATTTTTLSPPSSSSALPSAVTTKVEEIYNLINSTTTEVIETTTQQLITEIIEESSSTTTAAAAATTSTTTEMLPPATTIQSESSEILGTADIGKSLPTLTSIMGGNSGNMYPKNSQGSGETDVNVIIAITVSVIGVIALVLLVGFLYLMRKRQKQTSYSQRCRPVSLDEYTIDNASVSGSMRKSSALRASKRTYGNLAFDDPALRPNPLGVQELGKFVQEKLRIYEEFREVPQITSRLDEVPTGCEDKNRYANVLPLPETRVILQRLNDDEKSEYINANYVTGPKDPPNYYIACQAPLESTIEDFWRMIWEQQSRVIIQATDLIENGVEKCAEYLPPSVTLDNHSSFGDFQITLQNREVKDKYAISTLLLKHVGENATRELTHYWYKWPEVGVPSEEAPIIAMLLEARSSLISYAIEQANEDKEKLSTGTLKSAEEGTATATLPTNNSNDSSANANNTEINGNISMVQIKKAARNQGPLTIHCSPGTGRTGTIIACDIAIRSLETPKRTVDIPQIVYYVRRGRASAVLTKEQYEFIYKVANMYAAKITNPTNYN